MRGRDCAEGDLISIRLTRSRQSHWQARRQTGPFQRRAHENHLTRKTSNVPQASGCNTCPFGTLWQRTTNANAVGISQNRQGDVCDILPNPPLNLVGSRAEPVPPAVISILSMNGLSMQIADVLKNSLGHSLGLAFTLLGPRAWLYTVLALKATEGYSSPLWPRAMTRTELVNRWFGSRLIP